MISVLVYVLSFLLVALVSGNNMPACAGPIISSGIVDKKTGVGITVVGYVLGFLIEGGLLRAGLLSIMPVHSELLIELALFVALLMFVIAHVLRVPQSLSMVFTMAIVGIGYGYGANINSAFVYAIIAFWIVSTMLAGIATVVFMRAAFRLLPKSRVWVTAQRIKLLLVLVSFFTAFVLGANTIGFVFASVSSIVDPFYGATVVVIAIFAGAAVFSGGELRRLGNEILPLRYVNALISQTVSMAVVQIATMFSIPASNTQTLTASLLGAGLSYRVRLIRKRPVITIVVSWVMTAAVSFAIGAALAYSIYHL